MDTLEQYDVGPLPGRAGFGAVYSERKALETSSLSLRDSDDSDSEGGDLGSDDSDGEREDLLPPPWRAV